MIYLDTSVLLAQLLVEDHLVPDEFWDLTLISSRLIEYETWTRLHTLDRADSHGEAAAEMLGRVSKIELAPTVLARAREPFPVHVRTLDALHLSTALYLAEQRVKLQIATLDQRLAQAATAMGLEVVDV